MSSLTFGWPRPPPCSCPLPRSACLCSRNSAPGSRCCRRPLGSARPLPCTLGLCPALQLQAGLLLPTGQTTHTQPLPTARPLPDSQARLGVARDLRCGGHHRARIPPTDCSLRRSALTREVSERATASGQTRIPTAHHRPGGAGQPFTCDGTQAFPILETSSVPARCDH